MSSWKWSSPGGGSSPSWQGWIWDTWIGDSQVMYVIKRSAPDWGIWNVYRKVMGAAAKDKLLIGTTRDETKAKAIAEDDARKGL